MAKTGPSPLVVRASSYFQDTYASALEVGSGTELHDALFLNQKGLSVDIIDRDPKVLESLGSHAELQAQVIVANIEDTPVLSRSYDIIAAMYVLHFCTPERFGKTFDYLNSALNPNGLWCGTFLGKKDEWRDRPGIITHEEVQLRDMFKGYKMLYFSNAEWEGLTRKGTEKHWHVYSIIARKF